MTWKDALKRAQTRFADNGQFLLRPGESIGRVVSREKVPTGRGVYIIFRGRSRERPVYIGKAGTIRADGSWKDQGLRKRLRMKQQGESRGKFFRKLMAEKSSAGLKFVWFVTHNRNSKVIPALVEMELLQAHYDSYGCLPELNKSA